MWRRTPRVRRHMWRRTFPRGPFRRLAGRVRILRKRARGVFLAVRGSAEEGDGGGDSEGRGKGS